MFGNEQYILLNIHIYGRFCLGLAYNNCIAKPTQNSVGFQL